MLLQACRLGSLPQTTLMKLLLLLLLLMLLLLQCVPPTCALSIGSGDALPFSQQPKWVS